MEPYPARLVIDYPDDGLSRLTTLFRYFLLIPHGIVLGLFGIVIWIALIGAWFAILISGRFPRGLFNLVAGYTRWSMRFTAYAMLMTDRFPAFGTDEDPGYPARFSIDYPERLSRGLIFIKWILAIPHWIILAVFGWLAQILVFITWFVILFTGRYPRDLFAIVEKYVRWNMRVTVYTNLMTDRYPPFSGD